MRHFKPSLSVRLSQRRLYLAGVEHVTLLGVMQEIYFSMEY